MRSAPAVRCLLCISVCAKALVIPHGGRRAVVRSTPSMRAPWLKFAAAPGALAPRALQRGRDPRTLGEAWRWCRSYRFPEDVCEYAGAAGAALDPSAAAVAVYGCAQMVFAYRAFRRARASDEPGREAALGRGFLLIFLWHASHFLAHEFKKPWAWFGSHYFYARGRRPLPLDFHASRRWRGGAHDRSYAIDATHRCTQTQIFGFFQLARALNSTRAGARRLGAYLVGDGLLTAWGGDYVGLVSGVTYGAHAIRGCRTGDAKTDRSVRRLILGLSVAAATLFGAVEILFCHRLGKLGAVGFGSAHLAVELFVVGASITFSRALESVVRGGGHSELAGA